MMDTLLYVTFSILVIYVEGSPIGLSPNNLEVIALGAQDNSWFRVKWKSITNPDEADPILGYKVKVWKLETVKTTKYMFVNGNLQQTEVQDIPSMDLRKDPLGELTEIDVPANTTQAEYKGVQLGITYEIGVVAYTAKETGAFTNKIRITLNDTLKNTKD